MERERDVERLGAGRKPQSVALILAVSPPKQKNPQWQPFNCACPKPTWLPVGAANTGALFSNLAPAQLSTLIASLPVRALGLEGEIQRGEGKSANTNIVPLAFYKPGEWGS